MFVSVFLRSSSCYCKNFFAFCQVKINSKKLFFLFDLQAYTHTQKVNKNRLHKLLGNFFLHSFLYFFPRKKWKFNANIFLLIRLEFFILATREMSECMTVMMVWKTGTSAKGIEKLSLSSTSLKQFLLLLNINFKNI